MRKVFLMAALVLASTSGSNVCAMNEAVQEASFSELMPVKKTTKKTSKKKTTTKKTTAKKTTSSSTATSSAAASAPTTSTSTTTNSGYSAGSVVAGVLGGLLGGGTTTGSSIISGILNNVIGSATFSQADLCAHTWKYSKPGCAFTSENLLAKAGGEIAASKIEEDLSKLLVAGMVIETETCIVGKNAEPVGIVLLIYTCLLQENLLHLQQHLQLRHLLLPHLLLLPPIAVILQEAS